MPKNYGANVEGNGVDLGDRPCPLGKGLWEFMAEPIIMKFMPKKFLYKYGNYIQNYPKFKLLRRPDQQENPPERHKDNIYGVVPQLEKVVGFLISRQKHF